MFEDKVDALVEKVTRDFDPKAIIIFGSVAKGTATEDSDLDVAVIMDTDLSWTQRVVAVRRALGRFGMAVHSTRRCLRRGCTHLSRRS